MLYLKTDEEVGLLRESNILVSKTLAEVALLIKPGVTTLYLDKVAETFIRDNGAEPAFKGYGGFPGTLCTSVNDVVVHGFPSDYFLKDGDIISVDCGVILNGWYGDSAYTFAEVRLTVTSGVFLIIQKNHLRKESERQLQGTGLAIFHGRCRIKPKAADFQWSGSLSDTDLEKGFTNLPKYLITGKEAPDQKWKRDSLSALNR
jgi:methionyl aminopeptidase